MREYQREFRNFNEDLEYIYRDLKVPEDYDWRKSGPAIGMWVDCSWHNNSCPSFSYTAPSPYSERMNMDLYVDYIDPNLSQNMESRLDGSMQRFTLYKDEGCDCIYQTDSWTDMNMFIKGYIAAMQIAPLDLDEQDLIKPAHMYRSLNKAFPVYFKAGSVNVENDIVNNFFS